MANCNCEEYEKDGQLGGARHGDSYQIHVLMMLYLRAAENDRFPNFRLSTEWKEAGKFDDAVLTWTNDQEPISGNCLFIQVKHKISTVHPELNEIHFFPDKDKMKGDFSMYKYLASFLQISNSGRFAGSNYDFVIYTNAGIDKKFLHCFIETEFIHPLGSNGRFLKMNDEDEYVAKLLNHYNEDFNNLLQVLRDAFLNGVFESQEVVVKYRGALYNKVLVVNGDVVRLAPRFNMKNRLDLPEQKLHELLTKENTTPEQRKALSIKNSQLVEILQSKEKSLNTLPRIIDREEVKHFLKKLTVAIDQPNYFSVENIIMDQLRKQSPVKDTASKECYARLMYTKLHKLINDRLDHKSKCHFLCKQELTMLFQDVHHTIAELKLDTFTSIFQGEMQKMCIEFSDRSPLDQLFDSEFPVALHKSTNEGLLTCLKLYQTLENHRYKYVPLNALEIPEIQDQFDVLLNSNSTNLVLLMDNCSNLQFSTKLLETIRNKSQVKLIFLTSSKDRATTIFNNQIFSTIKDCENSIDKLKEHSQRMLLKKSVIFQGMEVALNELPRPELFLKDSTLEKLLQNKTIEIGTALPKLQLNCYIPRTISGGEMENSSNDLDDYSTGSDELESNEQPTKKLYSEEEFLDQAQDSDGNVILMSSLSGMGKTTLFTNLALLAKKLYKSKWILYVKLPDCAKKLKTLKTPENLGEAIDVLHDILDPESSFEQSLLSNWLQEIPKSVWVFFDGYDELPLELMDRVISLFRMLKSALIFVSTRCHQELELEQHLNVKAFHLESISENEQMDLFKSLLEGSSKPSSGDPIRQFIEQLVVKINGKSMEIACKFLGVPLLINMLAEIYKPTVNEFLQRTESTVLQDTNLDSLNIVELFEMFVYQSFKRHYVEKLKLDENDHFSNKFLDPKNCTYCGFVKLHNYLGLLSLLKKPKMHLIIRNKQELTSLEDQADRFLDSQIVPKCLNGVPQFIHSSIAEFFAAKCLYEYLMRMSFEQIKKNFVENKDNRNSSKKSYTKDLYDLCLIVLRDFPIVRKFFFFLYEIK
ncbi:uncharacterized protein LOC131439406 [Malaya genurostris]|uniref:uncharacterized protein LOC131439406 n=1 Tax=Malaya genurostris TaxID=325434 RepID=UPI0026F3B794|nr:uncharacterized protein LOC131439406 [Malaya genurostris]